MIALLDLGAYIDDIDEVRHTVHVRILYHIYVYFI